MTESQRAQFRAQTHGFGKRPAHFHADNFTFEPDNDEPSMRADEMKYPLTREEKIAADLYVRSNMPTDKDHALETRYSAALRLVPKDNNFGAINARWNAKATSEV